MRSIAILGELRARHNAHVIECLAQIFRARRVRLARGIGHAGVDRQGILRARAPGNDRRNVGGIELDLAVEFCAVVRRQRRPRLDRLLECRRPSAHRAGL